jgi:hypothetical protein
MANTLDGNIQSVVENFVAELTELVRRSTLETVSDALGGSSASRRTRSPRANGAPSARGGRRRKGAKRSSVEIQRLQDRLLTAIQANPGQRKEQLGAVLKAPTKELMLVTNKLLAAGAIRKRGVKRATTYYPR